MRDHRPEVDAFWRFSLLVYGRPGMAEALIRLQDRGGHNVNLILFAVWLAVCEGKRLDAAGVRRARALIADLDRAVVTPLRRLRHALKANPDPDISDLRRRVLALEIAAERRIQARLAAKAPRSDAATADRRALAEANLRRILGADFASAEAVPLRQAIAAF